MVLCKFPCMTSVPDHCDDCKYHGSRPDPFVGWRDLCELCGKSLDEDNGDEDWQWTGDGRPKNCPLVEVDEGKLSEIMKESNEVQ